MKSTFRRLLHHVFPPKQRGVSDVAAPVAEPVVACPADALRISVVDDPERAFHLVGVHGFLTTTTISGLADRLADISPRASVHLDLASATIVDRRAMNALELIVDALENRRVHLRMVGVDPAHPALSAN